MPMRGSVFGPQARKEHTMVRVLMSSLLVASVLGCAASGPAISKSSMGNLEINVFVVRIEPGAKSDAGLEHVKASSRHEVYIDDDFVGTVTPQKPVLYLKRGEHVVRVESPGFRVYEKTIRILGEPNHQVLNVILEKE